MSNAEMLHVMATRQIAYTRRQATKPRELMEHSQDHSHPSRVDLARWANRFLAASGGGRSGLQRLRTLAQRLAFLALLAAISAAACVTTAAAQEDAGVHQYRGSMWYFVPALGKWSTQLEDAVSVAQVKPERVCDTALPELARRGESMVDDLRGTAAPDEMADAHAQLIGTMEELTAIAWSACDDPAGYGQGLSFERSRLQRARLTILRWMLAEATPIYLPAVSVNAG